MAVVVRCTGCGGLARVGPEAVGLLVVCPRCRDPFLADPVDFPDPTAPAPPPPPAPPPRPVRAEPIAPPRPRRRRPAPEVHDHPPPTAGGVPFSVIIGLALLPLTIPMLWVIGPIAIGTPPAFTLATPVSLAVSAAVLCLAVAYTVDWSPVTRIKGVVTLLGLAYFAGLGLYFLKKDAVEWAQQKLGQDHEWRAFRPPGEGYEVELPGKPKGVVAGPVPVLKLTHYRVKEVDFIRVVTFTVGAGPDHDPKAADAEWFAAVERSLRAGNQGEIPPGQAFAHPVPLPNREWTITTQNGFAQVVRVFRDRAHGRVYLLSAQGRGLDSEKEDIEYFFDSFALVGKE